MFKNFSLTDQYAKPGLMEYNQLAVPLSKSIKSAKLPVLVDWDSSDRCVAINILIMWKFDVKVFIIISVR